MKIIVDKDNSIAILRGMTKKTFIALAEAVRSNGSFTQAQIEVLADFCQSQNPRFMRGRWIGYIKGENGSNGGAVR